MYFLLYFLIMKPDVFENAVAVLSNAEEVFEKRCFHGQQENEGKQVFRNT